MNIAFSTTNLLIKEKLRIITTVYEKNKKLYVKKAALNKFGISHLFKFIAAEEELRKNATNLNFVKIIRKQRSEIVYEYLEMPTLSQLIEIALIEKESEKVLELVKLGLKVIDLINVKQFNIYEEKEFVDLFDKNKQFLKQEEEVCLSIGVLDAKFDNILKDSNDLYLIDYEWIYNFPLPKLYIQFRSIYYLAISLQLIIDTLCSEDFPCYKAPGNVLIPKSWLDLINLDHDNLKRFLFYENNFQNFVNIIERKIDLDAIKKPEIVTSPLKQDLNGLSEGGPKSRKDVVKVFMMEQQISKLKKDLLSATHELESIKSSKFFKLWRKYHSVKKQVIN